MKRGSVVLNQIVMAGCLVGLLTVQAACGSNEKPRAPESSTKSQLPSSSGVPQRTKSLLPSSSGGSQSQVDNGESQLSGAVYAKLVPVYPGAQYVGSAGRQSGKSVGGHASSDSQAWFFKTSDPAEDVLAFYKKELPNAAMATDATGDSTFTLIPPGAEKGERVQVILRNDGFLQIRESLKSAKKQG